MLKRITLIMSIFLISIAQSSLAYAQASGVLSRSVQTQSVFSPAQPIMPTNSAQPATPAPPHSNGLPSQTPTGGNTASHVYSAVPETAKPSSCLANQNDKLDIRKMPAEIAERADACLISQVGKDYFIKNFKPVGSINEYIEPQNDRCHYLSSYSYLVVPHRPYVSSNDVTVFVPQNPQAQCYVVGVIIRDNRIIEPNPRITRELVEKKAYEIVSKKVRLLSLDDMRDLRKSIDAGQRIYSYLGQSIYNDKFNPVTYATEKLPIHWIWAVLFDLKQDRPGCVRRIGISFSAEDLTSVERGFIREDGLNYDKVECDSAR